jgi:Ca2+-binding RTX toxin-like protein
MRRNLLSLLPLSLAVLIVALFVGSDAMACTNTIFGTTGHDVIYGTSAGDCIYADPGNDTVYALGGDDQVYAGSLCTYCVDDLDIVWGGDGHDYIDGWTDDVLYGECGNDSIYGFQGDDELSGGGGDDYLNGEGGNDSADGGPGTDTCYAESTVNCE